MVGVRPCARRMTSLTSEWRLLILMSEERVTDTRQGPACWHTWCPLARHGLGGAVMLSKHSSPLYWIMPHTQKVAYILSDVFYRNPQWVFTNWTYPYNHYDAKNDQYSTSPMVFGFRYCFHPPPSSKGNHSPLISFTYFWTLYKQTDICVWLLLLGLGSSSMSCVVVMCSLSLLCILY